MIYITFFDSDDQFAIAIELSFYLLNFAAKKSSNSQAIHSYPTYAGFLFYKIQN
jgi:hypothetical protein|tara:strand:+ start:145 stop:306 length:162 start_codon:yes stop_codon:yes gene_type:complete